MGSQELESFFGKEKIPFRIHVYSVIIFRNERFIEFSIKSCEF